MPRQFAVLLLALAAAPLQAKSLYWRALDVKANLDVSGVLHIVERHTMVFDGDWNGGERRFRRAVVLKRLLRIEDGREIELRTGDLSQIDHYDWADHTVLRWRIRRPSDPPLHNQTFIYQLEYDEPHVLFFGAAGRLLNHDFAFPDRPGEIERFTLHLDIDPELKAGQSVDLTRDHIPPGKGVVITQDLSYAATPPVSPPAALQAPTVHFIPAAAEPEENALAWRGVAIKGLLWLAAAIAIVWFTGSTLRHLQSIGRPAPEEITDAWLDQNVFFLKPELLAYAYDGKVDADAVAATLARMAQEGKITTSVVDKGRELDMSLNVPIETLTGYEEDLAVKMFRGKTSTSTKEIRKAYKNAVFDPGAILRGSLPHELTSLNLWPEKEGRFNDPKLIGPVLIFIAAAVVLLTIGVRLLVSMRGEQFVLLAALTVLGTSVSILLTAAMASASVKPYDFQSILKTLSLIALAMTSIVILTPSIIHAAAAVFFAIAAYLVVTIGAKTSAKNIEKFTWRNRWSAAHDFFRSQLKSPHPHLRDEWYPWMIALGLGKNVDAWFHITPARAAALTGHIAPDTSAFGTTPSSASTWTQWTGGGGAFGGAGASGSWALAAASFGTGVNVAPSGSSLSGGSGSSGGGSSSSSGGGSGFSGGGGGGGW